MRLTIDTSFVRTDAFGNDPDAHSATLRRYHKLLWSKPLPSGALFDLDDTTYRVYLHHLSNLGEFVLSSDTVIPTFARHIAMKPIIAQISEAENEEFGTIRYTIGGMILWPGNQIDRKMTINGARGLNRRIADRMDLTLECIRRHYQGGRSPLGDVLARYRDFFALFEDFRGYVDFFLLQDLVTNDYSTVRCFMPFDDFNPPSLPQDVATYSEYRRHSIEFIQARNRRIDDLAIGSASAAQQEMPPISQQGHDIDLTGRPPSTAATSTGRFISSQVTFERAEFAGGVVTRDGGEFRGWPPPAPDPQPAGTDAG